MMPLGIRRRSPLFTLVLLACLLGAAPASAQLNRAYDEGYKPMLELDRYLAELADSAEKRAAYSAVKDLANRYIDRLDRIYAAFETSIGSSGKLKEGDNQSWIRMVASPAMAATREAKGRAEKLRARAEASQDSRAEVIEFRIALTNLTDALKRCWQEHQDRWQRLQDDYHGTLYRFNDSVRDTRRPVNDLGAKTGETFARLTEVTARSREASRIYMEALDIADRLRGELYGADIRRTPEEWKAKLDAWVKADEIVRNVNAALVTANKAVDDAQRAHREAVTNWERALAEFDRKEAESNLLYTLVLQRHRRAWEMAQEYRPFSW